MRVLFLTNYYPPFEVGGYEQLCQDVAVGLAQCGHVAAVLTSDHGGLVSVPQGEARVHRWLLLQPRYDARVSPAMQSFYSRPRIERANRRALHKVVAAFGPDVVFIWNLDGLSHELALDAEAFPGVATAYWVASNSPAAPDAYWRYWNQAPGQRVKLAGAKRLLRSLALAQMRREGKPVRPEMRHVAVVSEFMRRTGQAAGVLPPHTEVIYNGVETDLFRHHVAPVETAPPIRLLLAGRVSADKGVHKAVEALGRLAQARPQRDFHLTIAGDGPVDYRAELERLAERLGVGELVSFAGRLPRAIMPELMAACHILLLPTVIEEAFARVTLEAMAAGLAVVGTLTGGTGEILRDGATGLACTDSCDDLPRQIDRLLADPQLRVQLARNGQSEVLANYSMTRMVARVEDLLQRAVAEQREKPLG